MKRLTSMMLFISITFSLALPGFAAQNSNPNIIGTIYHEETFNTTSTASVFSTSESMTAISSYTENPDGSFSIYQYMNNVLIEKHTVVPGSRIVHHVFYNSDGSTTETIENVASEQKISQPNALAASNPQITTRNMGYMHYRHPTTSRLYSISVELYDEYYSGEGTKYTFYQGAAKTLADWTSTLISIWNMTMNPVQIISKIIDFLDGTGLLDKATNGVYTALVTRTVYCNYNNQEFTGTATAPSTNYPEGFLQGTYAVVWDGNQSSVMTEGYTVNQWGQSTFGRMMMYQVFGIDEAPTSWSNV